MIGTFLCILILSLLLGLGECVLTCSTTSNSYYGDLGSNSFGVLCCVNEGVTNTTPIRCSRSNRGDYKVYCNRIFSLPSPSLCDCGSQCVGEVASTPIPSGSCIGCSCLGSCCDEGVECMPTDSPTDEPSLNPTEEPTSFPTDATPTRYPTKTPTSSPTPNPTSQPTPPTTPQPTHIPTNYPTSSPTPSPTRVPTPNPTTLPTTKPTSSPTPPPTPLLPPSTRRNTTVILISIFFGLAITTLFAVMVYHVLSK